jgi:type III pantothenate kinase
VVQDGTTGLLVPPGSPAELARAILTMIEQPRLAARLGAAGRQVVAERFSIDRMVEATEREYLSLLARSPRWRALAC